MDNLNLQLNEHVNATYDEYGVTFTPDNAYALWNDTEETNLDENGNPYQYYLQLFVQMRFAEEDAPHIWAKLIDETMEVYGKTDPNQPELMSVDEPVVMKARTMSLRSSADSSANTQETSHTYIDENGIERPKKGVY